MIATQQIKSTTAKPIISSEYSDYEIINLLKWNNSKWKALCPYLLKTDGDELCCNPGGIIFENFYQGCKLYPEIYSNSVYASKYHMNNPKYLWWEYNTVSPDKDVLLNVDDTINYDLYFRWRNSLWSCPNPIRYPNKIHRRMNVMYSLVLDSFGHEHKLDYISARKELYMKEYIRLVRKLPEYDKLLNKLRNGSKLLLCEVDVPANHKKGNYGLNCMTCGTYTLSIEKLDLLLNDPSEAFGHALCIAYALLLDL